MCCLFLNALVDINNESSAKVVSCLSSQKFKSVAGSFLLLPLCFLSSDKYFNLVSIHVVLRCDVFGQEDQIVVSVVWLLLEEESEMDFLTLLGKWKVGGFGCQGCH